MTAVHPGGWNLKTSLLAVRLGQISDTGDEADVQAAIAKARLLAAYMYTQECRTLADWKACTSDLDKSTACPAIGFHKFFNLALAAGAWSPVLTVCCGPSL